MFQQTTYKHLITFLSTCLFVVCVLALAPGTALAAHTPGQWQSNNTGWWYETDEGYITDDIAPIYGYLYHFDSNGYMTTGWLYDENYYGEESWMYFDYSGAQVANQWIGNSYIDELGNALTDTAMMDSNNQTYFFDTNGNMIPPIWRHDSNGWYLELGSGGYPTDMVFMVDGTDYYFDGYYLTSGWVYDDVNLRWLYADSSGALVKGSWINGAYYTSPIDGEMVTDTFVNGYYLDENGVWDGQAPHYGWKQNSKGWWYENLDTGMYFTDGIYTINFEDYLFDANGYMLTGWLEYDVNGQSEWAYFHNDGHMANQEWVSSYFLGDYYHNGREAVCIMSRNCYVQPVTVFKSFWDSGRYYVGPDGLYDANKSKYAFPTLN